MQNLASSVTKTNSAQKVRTSLDAVKQTPAWTLFEEGGLATRFTCMGVKEATDIAASLFDIKGTLSRFATEKDDTFRIDANDGMRYVLKIANPHEPLDEINLQLDVLAHIQRVQPDLPVPRVLQNKQGARLKEFTDQAGQ